jgi:BolA protein
MSQMNRAERIQALIGKALSPEHISLEDDSGNHAGSRTESHYSLLVVSTHFEGVPQVRRHQMVYQQLGEELENGLHALALHTYSPEEWNKLKQHQHPDSPVCAKTAQEPS